MRAARGTQSWCYGGGDGLEEGGVARGECVSAPGGPRGSPRRAVSATSCPWRRTCAASLRGGAGGSRVRRRGGQRSRGAGRAGSFTLVLFQRQGAERRAAFTSGAPRMKRRHLCTKAPRARGLAMTFTANRRLECQSLPPRLRQSAPPKSGVHVAMHGAQARL